VTSGRGGRVFGWLGSGEGAGGMGDGRGLTGGAGEMLGLGIKGAGTGGTSSSRETTGGAESVETVLRVSGGRNERACEVATLRTSGA